MPDTRSLVNQYEKQKKPSLVQMHEEAQKPESMMGKVGDALSTVQDVLSYPQQKIFGAITGDDRADGDRVLEKLGMGQGLMRSAGGLALDLVADPINLIPGEVFVKAGEGLMKGAKVASKAAEVVPGIKTVKKIGTEVAEGVEKAFVQHPGTSKFIDPATGLSYQDKARLHASAVQSTTAAARSSAPTAAASVKAATAAKQAETSAFHQDIIKAFGSATPQPGYRIPDAYKKTLGTMHFPEAIAADIEKSAKFGSGDTENIWTDAMKVWKSYATSLNPSHHFVNMLGNLQNMYLGGVDGHKLASSYAEARAALKDPTKIAAKDWKDMTRYGVVGDNATFGGSMAPTGRVRPTLMSGKWNPLNPENAVANKMREFGTNNIEEPARVALYMARINKGDSPEKAALAVKKYLFDYSELTDAEKKVRDFAFPFYTFTRKNLPLQIEAIAKDPKRVNKIGDVLHFFDTLSPDAADATQPDYLSKEGFVPAPVKGSKGDPYMMRVALPIQDVNKVSSTKDVIETVGSMLNPVAKIIGELGTGHEFRGGIPVFREKGYQNPAVFAAMADKLGLDHIPGVEKALGLIDTPEGRKQLDLPAYAMRQIPFGNWLGRTIAPPEAEGGLNPIVNGLMRLLGTTPVQLNQGVQGREVGRRIKEKSQEERMKRLIMDK